MSAVGRLSDADFDEIKGLVCEQCRYGIPGYWESSSDAGQRWHLGLGGAERTKCQADGLRHARDVWLRSPAPCAEFDRQGALDRAVRTTCRRVAVEYGIPEWASRRLVGDHIEVQTAQGRGLQEEICRRFAATGVL